MLNFHKQVEITVDELFKELSIKRLEFILYNNIIL